MNKSQYRFEFKFKIPYLYIADLYNWLDSKKFFVSSFPSRTVNSLYFDSPNFFSASSNMAGDTNRSKFRIRGYGEHLDFNSLENTSLNFEIKKKKNNISSKKIFPFLNHKIKEKFKSNTYYLRLRVNSFLKDRNYSEFDYLRETIFIKYRRMYFENILNRQIRITIDESISYKSIFEGSNYNLISMDYVIAEIKFPNNCKKLTSELLVNFPFRQTRFSKYLSCMSKLHNNPY